MKTIFKVLLTISFVLSVSFTQAQTRFGIKGGLNFSAITVSGEPGNGSYTSDSKTGFNLGVISEIPLATDFYLQPGLLFSTKGGKSASGSSKTNNLEIPINALYKLNAGSVKVLGFAGPYIGYALSGKSGSTNIKFSGDNKDMNAFDLGLNIGAGVEVSNFQITAQYGFGLTNLAANSGNLKSKNKVFGVSVAYLFGGK
ncbi:MAG TPA: porin family protein [Paludibacter sp.]|nr:porin family protein [Paludibacter sp.]